MTEKNHKLSLRLIRLNSIKYREMILHTNDDSLYDICKFYIDDCTITRCTLSGKQLKAGIVNGNLFKSGLITSITECKEGYSLAW